MAKQQKITLTLDFNVERGKLQDIASQLNKNLGKDLKGDKTIGYFNNIKTAVGDAAKSIGSLYNELNKPMISKEQAKAVAKNIEDAFKSLDNKLFSLQGNIGKTFGSIDNAAALKKIRELGTEIDKLVEDYQKASQLLNKGRALGNKANLKAQLTTATKELDILAKKQDKLTTEEQQRQSELKKTIKDVNAALEEKLKISEQVAAIQAENGVTSQAEFKAAISDKITNQQELINGSISVKDVETLRTALAQIRDIIEDIMRTSNATGPKIAENIDDIIREQKEAEAQAKTFKSVLKELGIPMLTLREVARMMRSIVSYSYDYIKNLDKALTEISVVSGKTRQEVLDLTDTFIELSARTGMAIDDIAQASTIFYQQGLNDEAVAKLTEYTAIFAKISNETVEVAADQITAAMNGFGWAADQAGDIIDKLSVLAAYSAADIDELATAMSKAASQANMAGLSFDQYNAYLATMIEVTREAPENIGTSLKTIMSRFQSIKTGDNTEDDTDVNDVEKALRSVGVRLRDTEGQLRDLGDVLNELGPKWNSLDRNTQAYLGTVIAGTRQQSRFISLMQNWDRALELTEASQNSAGAATRMHAAAMQGLDASLNNLTNSWQKLISNIANGDSFKWLIDSLAGIVKWFANGNTLLKVFTIAVTAFNAKTLLTNLSLTAQGEKIKNLNTVVGTLGDHFRTLGTNMKSLGDENSKITQKISEEIAKVKELKQEYDNLAQSKQNSANAYQSNTDPTGATGTGGKAPTGGVSPDKDVPNVIPDKDAIDDVADSVKELDKVNKKGSFSIKTMGKNIVGLIGTIQTSINVALLVVSAVEFAVDIFTTTADEMREKAQKAYDKTQKEIDKRTELINAVEANIEIYERLSKKLNKSTEEVEQLADAADELAKAVPGSLIGYDANGNAIINTNAARTAQKNAEAELSEYAKQQIGNVGNLARAELRELAEQNYATSDAGKINNGVTTAAKWGTGISAGLATAATVATFAPEPIVSKGVAVVLWAATAISALVWGTSEAVEQAGVSAQELALAQSKAKEVYEEFGEQLLTNMSYITNQKVKDRSIDGVSENDRTTIASYIGKQWLQEQTDSLYNQLASKEISEEEYEKKFAALGQDWSDVLDKIDDRTLASAYKGINTLMEDIGDKTYGTVESAIEKIITSDMGISKDDPLFKTIKEAFMDAAYSGMQGSIHTLVKDLQSRKERDLATRTEGSDEYKEIEALYDKAINNVKSKMTNNQVSFYEMLGITDNVGLFNQVVDQYADTINEALSRSNEAAAVQSIAYLNSVKVQAEAKMKEITDTESDEYKKWEELADDAAASIEKAWNSLDISIDIPWERLWHDLEETTDRARTAWETLASLASGDGMDVSQWESFTTMLDDIDFSLFDTQQLTDYANALDGITESLTVVNGQIYANGEAIESVAQLEELSIQAKIQSAKQELINKKLELEAGQAVVEAKIKTLEWQILEAQGSEKAEEAKTAAEESWLTASNKMNTFFVQNQARVAEAMVNQYADAFTEVALKFNQLQTAMADGTITQDELNAINDAYKAAQKELNFQSYTNEVKSKNYSLEELKQQLEGAKKAYAEYGYQISNIDLKLATLDSGIWSSKNGNNNGKDKEQKLSLYIGKLEKIFNILNRIDVLSKRLNILDSYMDVSHGDAYAGYLNEQLSLTEELSHQYQFLTEEQKKNTNGYKEWIKTIPGLEDVFDFDEWGQIIINWEKYNALNNISVDGMVTLKQKADDVYDTYTEMFENVFEYHEKWVENLKKTLEILNKVKDAYVNMENKAADAIKEIYQKILDTRLEAIDKEIDAIEDLRKAREQARKDQENAEAISDLQTNLQRTMMDTSGASDSAFLKAQKDIDDKLSEIAEDKYSTMLDNIIDVLEEEKDALQDNFDQMFANTEWLFDWLEKNIMEDPESLYGILKQTQDWATKSPTERWEDQREWETNVKTYLNNADIATGGIKKILERITSTETKIDSQDVILKNQTIQNTEKIQQTIDSWQKDISSKVSGMQSQISGLQTQINNQNKKTDPGTPTKPEENKSPTADNSNYTNISNIPSPAFGEGVKVKTKEKFGYVTTYSFGDKDLTKNSDGTYTASKTNGGGTSGLLINGASFTTGKRVYYNGQWYYQVTDNSWLGSSNQYIKGLQLQKYALGGLVNQTGPAWLDGTLTKPEAVLNSLQTEHFIKFTNALDQFMSGSNGFGNTSSAVNIENISFNVESMSSAEDGEAAFNAFINKFKEIGSQSGLTIGSFKNNL